MDVSYLAMFQRLFPDVEPTDIKLFAFQEIILLGLRKAGREEVRPEDWTPPQTKEPWPYTCTSEPAKEVTFEFWRANEPS